MVKLLTFLIKNITGSDDFAVLEKDDDGRVTLEVKADKEIIGLIIGKEGKTIKTLRKILSIPASLAHQAVNIQVSEK